MTPNNIQAKRACADSLDMLTECAHKVPNQTSLNGQVFAPVNNPSTSWKLKIFSRFIGINCHSFIKTISTIKSIEDLKSQDQTVPSMYLGQTLSGLEVTKNNLRNYN